MENKLNISELLKDCPSGMELGCTMFENLEFDHIDKDNKLYPIRCRVKTEWGSYNFYTFTEYGCYGLEKYSKCVIFPKGKSTWEGFHRPFKDGDIITDDRGNIAIYKGEMRLNNKLTDYYCGYRNADGKFLVKKDIEGHFGHIEEKHLATEEEKQKLFNVIKANGYKWDPETKTLDELVESKEDIDDKIVMSGIYFDRENYADEVELHLGNYEIEIRDGKTYAVFKNQKTKISKPIFKVGDKIKHKDTVLTIITVQTNSYIVEDKPYNFGILMFSQQDKWELINEPKFKIGDKIKKKGNNDYRLTTIESINNNYYVTKTPDWFDNRYITDKLSFNCQDEYELVHSNKFDINTLKSFDSRVLVRDANCYEWEADIFGRYSDGYITLGGGKWKQCIPYKGNEHLLGTSDDCDNYYKNW